MIEKTAIMSNDNVVLYVAKECVEIFLKSGYRLVDETQKKKTQKKKASSKQESSDVR